MLNGILYLLDIVKIADLIHPAIEEIESKVGFVNSSFYKHLLWVQMIQWIMQKMFVFFVIVIIISKTILNFYNITIFNKITLLFINSNN